MICNAIYFSVPFYCFSLQFYFTLLDATHILKNFKEENISDVTKVFLKIKNSFYWDQYKLQDFHSYI